MLNHIELVEEVCPACYKFLQSIYDRKRMKNVRQIVVQDGIQNNNNSNKQCKSLYHQKLTDGFKSNF
ncbi:MAG: hypothetical protein M3247_04125 [Thermoproteota archaeon]|nr:hypothetical protein [Thermoproteota archaeon]